jgi:hypothetical protein
MSRVLAVIKPHIPMIRFKKGSLAVAQQAPPEPEPVAQVVVPATLDVASVKSGKWTAASVSLEWWEMPRKFKRGLIDESECDIINSGGREAPWC